MSPLTFTHKPIERPKEVLIPEEPTLSDMPYEDFLAERQKIVEARQRAQQRFDQIVTAGAAGALVFSITFLDSIAAAAPFSLWQIKLSWLLLLLALGLNFAGHFVSQYAFDSYLLAFDNAYAKGGACDHTSVASKSSRVLDLGSAVAFVGGIVLLALFAVANLEYGNPTNEPTPVEAEGISAKAP